MKPCEVVTYHGKLIIIVDISNTTPEEAIAYFPHAQKIIAQFPPQSALILTDVINASYTKESVAALKEFAAANTPYVKASATVGSEGLREILLHTVERYTKRKIYACTTRDEALDWLTSQE